MNNTKRKKNSPTREVSIIRLAPSLQILSAVVLFAFTFGISAFLLFIGQELLFNDVKDFLDPDRRKEIEGTVRNLRTISMFGALVPLILVLLWVAVADRTFVRPIANLLRAIEQVTLGNFSVSLKVKGRYGVGTLTERFNAMVVRLRQMHEREKEISRTKSEVISIVSHQLQTPLTATRWAMSSLLNDDAESITPKQKETLGKLLDFNTDMTGLVHNLLNVTRIEQNRFGYTFKKADVGAVVEGVVGEFQEQAKKRKIDLVLIPAKEPTVLRIDEKRIALALGNLIENALAYTPSGGSITVEIGEQKKGAVQISVRDTGIGILAADIKRLFTKFFRAENARLMRPGGSGLGLFIVKNIVERHGGKVWAESEEGKGSTFFITIPIKK